MSELSALAEKIHAGLASEQDLRGVPKNEIKAIKEDTSAVHYRFVTTDNLIETKAAEGEPQVFKHVASDETTDLVGDKILVQGWQLKDFARNPQLLWAHDRKGFPIGLVDKAWKGTSSATSNKALLTKSHLHPAEFNEAAPAVERMMASGALPGVSVGYISLDSYWPTDDEERKALGLGENGILFRSQSLMELSVCPVPCNPNALQERSIKSADAVLSKMLKSGEIRPDLVQELRSKWLMTDKELAAIRRRSVSVPAFTFTSTTPMTPPDTTSNYQDSFEAAAYPNPYVVGLKDVTRDECMEALTRATKTLLDKVEQIEAKLSSSGDEGVGSETTPTPPAHPKEEQSSDYDEIFRQAAKALRAQGEKRCPKS